MSEGTLPGDESIHDEDPTNPERRDFLGTVTGVVAGAGVAAACWPFVNSMNPTSTVLAKATTEVDLSNIPPGALKTVAWQGKPVFIMHRTSKEIKAMEASKGSSIDPVPDSTRLKNPEWLVVIGICTHLGCIPNRDDDRGWLCPCHGSRYDNAGRVIKGPAPRNLDLPPYQFLSKDRIIIGKADASQHCEHGSCPFTGSGEAETTKKG